MSLTSVAYTVELRVLNQGNEQTLLLVQIVLSAVPLISFSVIPELEDENVVQNHFA
jgi:hypothetical protein